MSTNILEHLNCDRVDRQQHLTASLLHRRKGPKRYSKIRKHVETNADGFGRVACLVVHPITGAQDYEQLQALMETVWTDVTETLIRIGRIQLFRTLIANELRSSCKLNSGSLFTSLRTINEALLADLNRHYHHPDEYPMPGDIIAELSPFLDAAGLADPQSKVYVTCKPIPELVLFLIGLILKNVSRLKLDNDVGNPLATKKQGDLFDGAPFSFGVTLLLKQFHSDQRDLFWGHVSQVIRVSLCDFHHTDVKQQEKEVLPIVASLVERMLGLTAQSGHFSVNDLNRIVPPQLFW